MKKDVYYQVLCLMLFMIFSTTLVHAGAIRSGFNSHTLPGNDDMSTDLVDIGFDVNFFGRIHTQCFINNNGNITFDAQQSVFTPYDLTTTNREIIAPFFADVDTYNSDDVTYGEGTVDGRIAFGINWINVGYYDENNFPLNSFQMVLIDRSDINPGDFDVEFNYDEIGWETGDASGGSGGLGGSSARVGYSNGTWTTDSYYEFPGSGISGDFLDGGPHALTSNSVNSSVRGRYVMSFRNGDTDFVYNPKPIPMAWLPLLLD